MKKSYIVILLVLLIGISLFNVVVGFFTGGGKEEVVIDRDQLEIGEIDAKKAQQKMQINKGNNN